MTYVLLRDEAPGPGLARIIGEQTRKLREAANDRADTSAFVHKARIRCKRIRAALRLARPLLGERAYHAENVWWRDASRGLSHSRDLTARLEALAGLPPDLEAQIGSAVLHQLRIRFEHERRSLEADPAVDAIQRFCNAISRERAEVLSRIPAGEPQDLARGLAASYRRARTAMSAAMTHPSPAAFHEWRKQTKYHVLHMRLAREVLPGLQLRWAAARELAGRLGAAQDLDVLQTSLATLRADRSTGRLLEGHRRAILEEAEAAGERLFDLRPKGWSRTLVQALDLGHAAPDL